MTTPLTPMNCDGLAESLADYLEGDAPETVRRAIDAHASGCDDCRSLIADLRDISASAASLPMLEPSHDLWAGIAERIDAPVLPMGARTVRVLDARRTWLRPAVAAAALVIATAGITHYLTRATLAPAVQQVATRTPSQATPSNVATPQATDTQAAQVATPEPTAAFSSTATERAPRTPVVAVSRTNPSASRSPGATSAAPLMGDAEPVYDSEIGKLRRIVKQRRNDLDPKTVAVLEQSIAVIDSAIAQSRAALRKDPASGFLANQLNHSLEKKVELLRTAAMLPART